MSDHIEYFECDCLYPDHLVRLCYIDEDVYLTVFFNTYSIYDRIKNGFKYLFSIENNFGMFDTWILGRKDIRKFINSLGCGDDYPLNNLQTKFITNPVTKLKTLKIYYATCGVKDDRYWYNIEYDTDLKMMTIDFSLAYSRNFYIRLWKTIKYIFGYYPTSYDWKLSKDDTIKLYECAKLCSRENNDSK